MPALIHGETSLKSPAGKRVFTPEYQCWANMIRRCTSPNWPQWEHYGGRGIAVAPEWYEYKTFLRDMGRRPSPRHSLDRINNSLGYSKENCRWATQAQQRQNSRQTKLTKANVEEMRAIYVNTEITFRALGELFGVSAGHARSIMRGENWREI